MSTPTANRTCLAGAMAAAVLAVLAMALASAQPTDAARLRPALAAPLAGKAPLTAVARAGDAWVAVGDYGVVLRTDDGRNWRQAQSVPVDTLLTATSFVSADVGWAVGHGGVVLATRDGGRNWSTLALLEGAPALLSVWFRDPQRGIVTGAYGAAFGTRDGGRTWSPLTVGRGRDAELRHFQVRVRVADELARVLVRLLLPVHQLHPQHVAVEEDGLLDIGNGETEVPGCDQHGVSNGRWQMANSK